MAGALARALGNMFQFRRGFNDMFCAAREADLDAANEVGRRVHGHDRAGEVRDAIRQGTATVVERHDRITGYATGIGFFGHAVGETAEDVMALILPRQRLFPGPAS